MCNTIFEYSKFHKLETCLPQYMDLVNAVEQNYNMDLLNLFESDLSEGLYIHVKLHISIPTNGVYEELDVHSEEEIVIYAKTDYPLSAPAVLFVRNDFPSNRIPHLNLGVSDSSISLLNPCLYRGNIDEWFYQNGPEKFCDRINGWFSDLVNGELINEDGFETVRDENIAGIVEVDFDYLFNIILKYQKDYGSCVLKMKKRTDKYFKILNEEYSKNLKEDIVPCLFVFDRKNVISDYISKPFYTERDLKLYPCEHRIQHGIRKIRGKYYEPQKIDNLNALLIILAVKRPMQVIGSFSEYEFIAFSLSYDFNSSIAVENCRIEKIAVIQSLNQKMAERLSGTKQVNKKNIIILGCGALGSKISMSLMRMGYTHQYLYDNDLLLPHNLVRHYENSSYAIGISKSKVVQLEMNAMFDTDSVSHYENIFHVEELPDGLVVDCTASKRSLLWSVSSGKIKSSMLRSEIYLGGKIGLTMLEGKNRKPDIYDLQIAIYKLALNENIISQWLNYKQPEDMQYHIGFGCSSDTMILDDATISNHASVVPHLINKYQNTENGIICINIFDKNNMTNNRLLIYEIEPMEIFQKVDGWSIHINRSIYQKVQQYSNETQENAGLWIGHIEERIKRITIVDTFIPDDNVRKNASVTMGNKEVNTYLKTLAVKTNGLIKYIGEWHTHTSGDASPSQQDIKTFEETKVNISAFLMTIVSPSNTCNYIIKGKHNG